LITKTQWDNFKKDLRRVRKKNAVIYTRNTDELCQAIIKSEEGRVMIPTYGGSNDNKLTILSVPMDEDCIYLSRRVVLTRDLFKDLDTLNKLFYIERDFSEYVNDMNTFNVLRA